jgi:hypothetical protein
MDPGRENVGGQAGGPSRLLRSELKVLERAVRKGRWTISDKARDDVPAMLELMALESESERVKVAAAKVLAEMDKSNMEQERRDSGMPDRVHQHTHLTVNLEAKLARLSDDELADLERLTARLVAGGGEVGAAEA